jgi:hypothetical protein
MLAPGGVARLQLTSSVQQADPLSHRVELSDPSWCCLKAVDRSGHAPGARAGATSRLVGAEEAVRATLVFKRVVFTSARS